MDKLKVKARSARNRVAEQASRGSGSASLSVPHSALPPEDNASVRAVNEGFIGPQPGTTARDFADTPAPQPAIEPPTSLQSSVDAGKPVPVPPKNGSRSKASSSLQVPTPGRARSNSAPNAPPPPAQRRPSAGVRQSSIGIRRVPSAGALRQVALSPNASTHQLSGSTSRLPALEEECQLEPVSTGSTSTTESDTPRPEPSRLRKVSSAIQTRLPFWKGKEKDEEGEKAPMPAAAAEPPMQYSSNMVDVLDTLDPEVQTLTSLTNIQNSLFVPNLGRFVNRRPTYNIQRPPSEVQSLEEINSILAPAQQAQSEAAPTLTRTQTGGTMATLATIDSRMSDSRYAVLPHGASLEGWTKEDKKELNDHVRHMLHSRRSKFKRSMRGFGQYVKRPLGFLVTLYATLITLFGLAWVLFLIGWINVGGKQIYVVHIIDSVLVALFAIVGDGLAPFRAIDTYHMIYIAHYHHYTWSRRKKDLLPELRDHNDLPTGNAPMSGRNGDSDLEDPEKQWEFTVLTPKQQAKLEHHESKFCKSHSFYKPHETETHYAFPLRLLIAIVVLLDCHSLLQISLGACTWGIYYKVRPFALTTVILCCSITCNATAGLLIMIGDRRTRKKDVLERMNRQDLTEEAMHKVEKKKDRESESEREDGDSSKKQSRSSLDILRKPYSHRSGKEKEKEKAVESAYP
ncbi:hypothetical protein BU26DRAFT_529623 [Trematosphaeria pertusa]|uniref:Integral membrane protein n=1 Tax=Trematosphaeria pertusa TaxID=390896 RepID=A0A6A6IPY2_9PLEO|nr:uncharacterized protein BU26DRAFT_529623 [Trematosphaeria pertusa]KAF2252604.1 hypothetical protein BU26DRAFT_529623 [Trematosphaeria pertusa]